ncbi:hypothetical protein EJ08DRAFT_698653 [Tothia fuscella]|uniref:Uncharacterized protein n=1 Tax=Tothia fuscella TaxID=1048955 RepID=A0A9P4NP37_9PEZI|nr:hypothetical protein EJ08DRAFT_698653 [Tothia fuscella]
MSNLPKELQDLIFTHVPPEHRHKLAHFLYSKATNESATIAMYSDIKLTSDLTFGIVRKLTQRLGENSYLAGLVQRIELGLSDEAWSDYSKECIGLRYNPLKASSTADLLRVSSNIQDSITHFDLAIALKHAADVMPSEVIFRGPPRLRKLTLRNMTTSSPLLANVTELTVLGLNGSDSLSCLIWNRQAEQLRRMLEFGIPALEKLHAQMNVQGIVHPQRLLFRIARYCAGKPLKELKFYLEGDVGITLGQLSRPIILQTSRIPTLKKVAFDVLNFDFCSIAGSRIKMQAIVASPRIVAFAGLGSPQSPLEEFEFRFKHSTDGLLLTMTLLGMRRHIEAGLLPNLRKISFCADGQLLYENRHTVSHGRDITDFFTNHPTIQLDFSELKRFVKPWNLPVVDKDFIWGQHVPLLSSTELSAYLRRTKFGSAKDFTDSLPGTVYPEHRDKFK